MKDYTVSVKHFLNTALKPSIVNNKIHYPVYLMINAKRKTSRLKSLIFWSDYTEQEFENQANDIKKKIAYEIPIIERILRLTIQELKEYNTTFFNAYTNFCYDVPFVKIKPNEFIYQWNDLSFTFINNFLLRDKNTVLTVLDLYSNDFQKEIKQELKKQITNNRLDYSVDEVLNDFNKMVFYDLMEYFIFYLKGNRKTRKLVNVYNLDDMYFNQQQELIKKYIFK